MAGDARYGPVLTGVCRDPSRRVALEQPDVVEDGLDVGLRHVLVLGREGIDRRRDHEGSLRVGPTGRVLPAGEHVGVDLLEVWTQEGPRPLDVLVRDVGTDVAAPDHHGPGSRERMREPRRLGIVEEDDVARPDESEELLGVRSKDLFIVAVLRGAEGAPVTRRAVEVVVDPLGDGEEAWVPFDDDPLGVNPRTAGVRQERAEHLRDAAAGRGGVDVQDSATCEPFAGGLRRCLEPFRSLRANERKQARRRACGEADLLEPHLAATGTRHSTSVPPPSERAVVRSPPIVAARRRRFGRPRPSGGVGGRPLPLSVTRTTRSVPASTTTLTWDAPECCATLDNVSWSTARRCSAVCSETTVSSGPSMLNSGEKPSSSRAPSTMAKIDTRRPRWAGACNAKIVLRISRTVTSSSSTTSSIRLDTSSRPETGSSVCSAMPAAKSRWMTLS